MKLLKMLVSGALIALGVFAGTATVHATTIVEFDFTDAASFGGPTGVDGKASFGPVSRPETP